MKKLLATCAVALIATGAQTALAANAMAPTTPSPSMHTQSSMHSNASIDLAAAKGQTVFDAKGNEIGTIDAVTAGNSGQQQAVVSVGKFLGIGGKDVLLPVSALQAKAGGGFTTTLSAKQIKALPEYKGEK